MRKKASPYDYTWKWHPSPENSLAKHTSNRCSFACLGGAVGPGHLTETGDAAGWAALALVLWAHFGGHGKPWPKGLYPAMPAGPWVTGHSWSQRAKMVPAGPCTGGLHQESLPDLHPSYRDAWAQPNPIATEITLQRRFLTFSLVTYPLKHSNLCLKNRFAFNISFFF